ncbi:hypothetical protein RB594_007279 [Gaeumannomyces avenae]
MAPRQPPRKRTAAVIQKTEVTSKTTSTVRKNGRATKVEATVTKTEVVAKGRTAKRKATEEDESEVGEGHDSCCGSAHEDEEETEKPVARSGPKQPAKKQKTVKDQGSMPLVERTAISTLKKAMYIGAHVSAAGGIQNSIQNSLEVGGNAFALFLKSQRTWNCKPLDDAAKAQFRALCEKHSYDAGKHCLPHGSYLVNLAQADKAKADQAFGNFVDDLKRCDALGIGLYNFHPGSALGGSKDDAIARIAHQLNRSHRETERVVTVIENMAGAGSVVGSRFEDLRDIIDLVHDKARVGVCIDTCHAFAAGYDMRTPEAFAETAAEFDRVVGNRYLRAFHLNDSKAPLGCNRDLHANIGTGFLGLRAFHSLVNHDAFQNLPMVLETPITRKGPDGKDVEDRRVWADEIKLLESLIGMDPESEEFKEKEEELQRQGASERERLQGQADKKAQAGAKKAAKKTAAKKAPAKKRGKKKADSEDEDESN